MEGYVHSIYSGGMVDGPGIRTVVFFSGCPLRCLYCHNPDTWELKSGTKYTVEEIIKEVLKYKSFYKTGGGVTISGGEPLMQAEFLTEVLKGCKQNGIHTVVDTSGYANMETARDVLRHTDLLLLDIKSFNSQVYEKLTGVEIEKTLNMLQLAREMNIPTWIRYVLVPGLTDNENELREMTTFLQDYPNVKKIDILPFHKTGEFKWKEQGIPYQLADTQEPSAEAVTAARQIVSHLHDKEIFYDDFYQ